MLKNYIIIAIRNIRRHKSYSLINIFGLLLGFSCFILIMLWVQDEISYDKYHRHADRICRVTHEFNIENYHTHFARVPLGYVNALPEEFEEIQELVRFRHELHVTVKYGDRKFNETRFFHTDENVFDVFNFKLANGDPKTVLQQPNSILITRETVKKYFGDDDPIGKTLLVLMQNQQNAVEYQITGILEEIPPNSHFHFDFLASQDNKKEDRIDGWNYVYVLLNEYADPRLLQQNIPSFIKKYTNPESADFQKLHLQPLTDIHLHSNLNREIEPNGNILYVYIFAAAALLILLIAIINYTNLTTARSLGRAFETGIRKAVGAGRRQIIFQFLGESIFISFLALIGAIILAEACISAFNEFSGNSIQIHFYNSLTYIIGLLGLALAAGIAAGGYPALIISGFNPVIILKSKTGSINLLPQIKSRTISLRNIFVVIQFSITIVLIICCTLIYYQHDYLMSKRLGQEEDQIVAIPNVPDAVREHYDTFKDNVLKQSGVIDVTASMEEPSKETLDAFDFTVLGKSTREDNKKIYALSVDSNFIRFFNIELVAGEDFRSNTIMINPESYIINETAARMIGWNSPEEAIGQSFKPVSNYAQFEDGSIIGVVKDFGQSSLKKEIKPLLLFQRPIWYFCFLVKIEPDKINSTLAGIRNTWNDINSDYPFQYYYIDDLFAKIYQGEKKQQQILGFFSIIGVFIACMGLFGLITYTIERRRKEIGIRKILGASVSVIIKLLIKEFLVLVIMANLIAWPVAFYMMNRWLEGFAYRTSIGIATFILAGFSALFIALVTVSYQAIKAARTKPVKAIQHE